MHRLAPTMRAAVIGLLVLVAAGCSDGQLVDAGGENGGGGLAFVVMTFLFLSFIGALFYMDRVRTRRSGDSQK